MKPNEGQLQTAEHILAKIIENKFKGKVVIAKFDKENLGILDISSGQDLKNINIKDLEREINNTISKDLQVNILVLKRETAEKEFNLTRVPESIENIRIVEIQGFDKRPCKDPHVSKTSEIGIFHIIKIEKSGKERYRFTFGIKQQP